MVASSSSSLTSEEILAPLPGMLSVLITDSGPDTPARWHESRNSARSRMA